MLAQRLKHLLRRQRKHAFLKCLVTGEQCASAVQARKQAAYELRVLYAYLRETLPQSDFALVTSSAVKPSFSALSNSSRIAASTFAMFCGAAIACIVQLPAQTVIQAVFRDAFNFGDFFRRNGKGNGSRKYGYGA